LYHSEVFLERSSYLGADSGHGPDLRMRMINDGHHQLEAAWQSQETIKEVLSGLECVKITMELTVLDHTRNMVSIKNALQDMEGTVMALRRVFCNRELRMYG
jgi:hypothetical protein